MASDNDKYQEYLAAIRGYYIVEYNRALSLDVVGDGRLTRLLNNFPMQMWGHKNRLVTNIQLLKYAYAIGKTDVLAVCLKVTLDGISSIYAYVYFQCEQGDTTPSALRPRFVCHGPTFKSQDGEYRRRVIVWLQFERLFVKYADVFAKIEALVVQKMKAARLTFQVDSFFPIGCAVGEDKVNEFIDNQRLPIKLFVMCWAHDFFNIHEKIAENHMSPAYQQIIYQADDIPIFNEIVKTMTRSRYMAMVSRCASFKIDPDESDYNLNDMSCGQKITPLSAIEAVKTDDINFNVWREIYIANLTSNLVLNLISPSFPFINNWFYIQNAHGGLFENLAMHEKYTHSAVASDISRQLQDLDKFNYVKADRDEGAISSKFFRLSKSIHRSIIYADSDIKLTDLAVCVTSEYVGRTMRDLPTIVNHTQTTPDFNQGYIRTFTDISTFSRHMFEFIYAFYCMNSKIGIIHGDIHMNNATIFPLYTMMAKDKVIIEASVLYIVGQQCYVFPHTGLFSMIIDFSRAVVGDSTRLEHEFGPRYAEMYFIEQRLRVLQLIYNYFPKFVSKYRDQIEGLILTNFPLVFKAITVVDTFVIMSNVLAMFALDNTFVTEQVKIAPGAHKLLKAIIARSETLFVDNMQALIDRKVTSVDELEWPNLTIIRELFADNVMDPADIIENAIQIVDVFNHNNDMKWDIEDYDTWGPLLSVDKELELRKKFDLPQHYVMDEWVRMRRTDESPTIEALTSKYEQQERDVLDFEEWMLT